MSTPDLRVAHSTASIEPQNPPLPEEGDELQVLKRLFDQIADGDAGLHRVRSYVSPMRFSGRHGQIPLSCPGTEAAFGFDWGYAFS
jgi:hypothetical protein